MTRKFSSLKELARALSQNKRKVLLEAELGLVQAAELIQGDARNRLDGGIPGDWAPLSAATEVRRAESGQGNAAPLSGNGVLRESIVVERDGGKVAIGSALDVAAWQEFGTATIPPRPFLGPALMANEKTIVELVGKRVVAALKKIQ